LLLTRCSARRTGYHRSRWANTTATREIQVELARPVKDWRINDVRCAANE
jgi:hypothetical protein